MSTAQRENAVIVMEDDYKTKYQSYDPNSPESYITLQLQWQAFYQSSLLFAEEVIKNLAVSPLVKRSHPIDQDVFHVLVEANMPAVLLELAFVTNPDECKYLSSEKGQNEIAERLFKAFKSYKQKYDSSFSVEKETVVEKNQPQTPKVTKEKEEKKVSGEHYGIQIMGLGRKLNGNDAVFKGLQVSAHKSENSSMYKYIYGNFSSFAQAQKELPKVREKFPEAFVVYIYNGNVERAKK
jgi:N-acetylmuramoyl-L-alanine amidase